MKMKKKEEGEIEEEYIKYYLLHGG